MGKILYLSALAATCSLVATVTFAQNVADDWKWNPSCVTFQGGPNNFGATYKDPKTREELEAVAILQDKEPQVYRKGNERGLLRKYCEREIIDHLGHARAKQVLRLSD